MASVVFGDHLLKAEAKKKKSKSKNKKAKQKSSKKAKEKQSKKAKQLAKMKKQVDSMQKQLLAMKAVVDKKVQAEQEAKQKAANTLRNIELANAAQVARLNLAPAKPATTVASNNGACGITMSCAPNSAGITAPLLSYHPTQSPSVSLTRQSVGTSLVLRVGTGTFSRTTAVSWTFKTVFSTVPTTPTASSAHQGWFCLTSGTSALTPLPIVQVTRTMSVSSVRTDTPSTLLSICATSMSPTV